MIFCFHNYNPFLGIIQRTVCFYDSITPTKSQLGWGLKTSTRLKIIFQIIHVIFAISLVFLIRPCYTEVSTILIATMVSMSAKSCWKFVFRVLCKLLISPEGRVFRLSNPQKDCPVHLFSPKKIVNRFLFLGTCMEGFTISLVVLKL